MADIFISYVHEDRKAVRRLVDALREQSWSVWWDPEVVAGEHYDLVIERELGSAKCIVVVWSTNSLSSGNVRNEAVVGRDRRCLIQVTLGGTTWPLTFSGWQAVDLSGWTGDPTHTEFQRLCLGIRRLVEQTNNPEAATRPTVPNFVVKSYPIVASPSRKPRSTEIYLSNCISRYTQAWFKDPDLSKSLSNRLLTFDQLLSPPKDVFISVRRWTDAEQKDLRVIAGTELKRCMRDLYVDFKGRAELGRNGLYLSFLPLHNPDPHKNPAARIVIDIAQNLHRGFDPVAPPIAVEVQLVLPQ